MRRLLKSVVAPVRSLEATRACAVGWRRFGVSVLVRGICQLMAKVAAGCVAVQRRVGVAGWMAACGMNCRWSVKAVGMGCRQTAGRAFAAQRRELRDVAEQRELRGRVVSRSVARAVMMLAVQRRGCDGVCLSLSG